MNTAELDTYCQRYLNTWDKRATLRSLDRFRLAEDVRLDNVYPGSKQPLADHPTVVALGPEARARLMVLSACQVMHAVAGIEVVVVTDICSKIATESLSFDLPLSARQVALTVAADESYHAYVAQEFIDDLENLTGIRSEPMIPGRLDEVPIIAAVRRFRQAVPDDMRVLADVVAVCFAENFLTEDLYDLSREAETDSVFQRIIREHIMDEGRHQQYFQRLLAVVWRGIGEHERTTIGKALPAFLDDFLMDLGKMEGRDLELLRGIGLSPEESQAVLNQVYDDTLPRWRGYKGAFEHAQPSYRLLETAGMLDHAPTVDALRKATWIPQ